MGPEDIAVLGWFLFMITLVVAAIFKITIYDDVKWFVRDRLSKKIQKLMRLIGYQYSWFNKTQFMILLLIVVVALSVWGHLLFVWNAHEMSLKERVVTKTEYKDKEKKVYYCEKDELMNDARNACNNGSVKSFEIDQKGNPKVICN